MSLQISLCVKAVDVLPDALWHGVGSRLLVLLVACGRAFSRQVSTEVTTRGAFQLVCVLRDLRIRAKAPNFKAHLAYLLLGGSVVAGVVVGDEVCEVVAQPVDTLQRGAIHG